MRIVSTVGKHATFCYQHNSGQVARARAIFHVKER
jgi:hypothetical protein